jgi:glycosyltransferase involved in cell wall biosynthesis
LSSELFPVSSLRPDLDRGWPVGARWLVADPSGEEVLEQLAGSAISFRLKSRPPVLRVRGQAKLGTAPAGRGTIGVRVRILGTAGVSLWEGHFRHIAGKTFPPSLEIDLSHDGGGDLELQLELGGPVGGFVHWRNLRVESSVDQDIPATPTASESYRQRIAEDMKPFEGPRFSILTPVHDPPLDVLSETIDSVLAQTYGDWELCLVDDGSSDPGVTAALERAAGADTRIHLRRNPRAGGISAATNAALAMAEGEFIALLDHDDLLVPDALTTVARILDERPETDMLYSDEELLAEQGPNHVFAKPHWSPDLLRSQMYTCHLGVYRRSMAEQVGGFRPDFDGSQDFDFALRFTERTSRVVHIPRILYRWRVHAGSSAGSTQAKPAAYPAARRALTEHLNRTGVNGDVYFGPWQGIYRVVHQLPAGSRVTVGVVGTEDSSHLMAALADAKRSGVAEPGLISAPSLAALVEQTGDADVIVFADGDFEALTHGWLSRLAAFALVPGVAAVGARTLAPDGRVENGALTIDHGLPNPILLGGDTGDPGPLGIGLLPANATAVGGVVAIARTALGKAGGFDYGFGNLSVADYCLRAVAIGERVVSAPDVLLRRHGPGPINDLDSLGLFRRRWGTIFVTDPYMDRAAGWAKLEAGPTIG